MSIKYSPPELIHVKDLSDSVIAEHGYDSVVVVSTDFDNLPSFPGVDTVNQLKEV